MSVDDKGPEEGGPQPKAAPSSTAASGTAAPHSTPAATPTEAAPAAGSPDASAAPPGHPEHMPEGEESPPRGARFMAVFRWGLVALMALAAVASILHVTGALRSLRGEKEVAGQRYHCPMHPSIVSDQPGDCPICSMSLVPIEDHGHAEEGKGGAGQAGGHEGHRHEPSDPYFCPMHPEETGTSADARCPICGMKMEAKPDAGSSGAGAMNMQGMEMGQTADAGVPGLVPIELKPERLQLIGMMTEVAKMGTLSDELRAVGFVTPDEQRLAEVTTRFSGWIEQLFVNETGQRVKQGQVLATIYSPELLTAQQELLNARRWSEGSARETSTTVAGSLASDARTRLKLMGVAEKEIEQIEQTGQPFRALPLRSGINGYVIVKNAFAGSYVQPGTELFRLADLSRVWVLADVYEHELSRVSVGQPGTLSLAAYPAKTFSGKVTYVYPTVESSTRTIRVRLEFKNPKLELRPGMYGEVSLKSGTADKVVLVPGEAVVDNGDIQYVFVAKGGGRFEPRRVKVGARSGDAVQILSGVRAGEEVVTTGNFLLDSESSLRFRVSGPSFGGTAAGAQASACASDFDAEKFPDKYQQCLACEQQHRGMGTMEQDCKNTIAKPWK